MDLQDYQIHYISCEEKRHLQSAIKLAPHVIYDERNRLVTYGNLVVKNFKIPSVIKAIGYRWIGSKAQRSFVNAKKIVEKGVVTALPVAYGEEYRIGILRRSFYAAYLLEGYKTIWGVVEKGAESDPELLKALVRYIYSLHQKGIDHKDLSPGNILYKRCNTNALRYDFALVDVNRMSFGPIPDKRKWESLSRLFYRLNDAQTFAKNYALVAQAPWEDVVNTSVKAGNRFFSRKIYKWMVKNERKLPAQERRVGAVVLAILSRLIRGGKTTGWAAPLYRFEKRIFTPQRLSADIRGHIRNDYL